MSKIELRVPPIGESINEVTLSRWLVEDGSYIEMDQSICEFESDKATLEFPAEASGIITYVAAEDDDLEIGGLVATLDTSAKAPEKQVSEDSNDEVPSHQKEVASNSKEGVPSPAAAKILREKNIESTAIKGSGKDGRITKGDAIKAEIKEEKSTSPTKSLVSQVRQESFSRNERREKMSRMRRTIAKRLVSAKNNTAMLTTFNEVDLSGVIALRKKHQDQFVESYGIKLGFMSLFAKACVIALKEMPAVNARLDEDHLVYHDFVDISIAISTPSGLVVPPVKNVESLKLHEIELTIKELAEKARNNTLSLEEMSGGTFTITNGGIFGSMMSTPILNEPQSAILGMHNIIQRPIAVNGNVEIRPMMYLALSYDHRVIDGSTSVTFLVRVKELLEDPVRMMLFS